MLDTSVLQACLGKDLTHLNGVGVESVRDSVDECGASTLHYAVRARGDSKQQHDILDYLVKKCGCNVHAKTHNGATPLHDACATGNIDAVTWLLSNTDCSAEDGDNSGILPVHLVSRFGHLNILKMLVNKAQASLHVKTLTGARPLHFAAAAGHFHIVQFILENRASFHNEDEKHRDYGDTDCPCCKLAHIVNVQMESGATPLYLASQNGNIETVKHLINVGNASVKILTCDGMSCLHAAAQSGHLNIVQYLAEQQKVDSKDLDGLTALHYAAGNGQVHVVKWLVNHGAKMLVDFVGGTPLHTAAHNGSSECALALLDGGCDPLDEDSDGLTALEIAAKCGHFGFAGCITKWQRQNRESKVLTQSHHMSDENMNLQNGENSDDYERVPGEIMSIPPPPSYPPPQVPEITRLKRQERVELNNKDTTMSHFKGGTPSSKSPDHNAVEFGSDQEIKPTEHDEPRSRTNSFKSIALTARLSFDKKISGLKRDDSNEANAEKLHELENHAVDASASDDHVHKVSPTQREKIGRFKAVAKATKLSIELQSQLSEDTEVSGPSIEKSHCDKIKSAPKRTNSLKLIGHMSSFTKTENKKHPPEKSASLTKNESVRTEEDKDPLQSKKEADTINNKIINRLNAWASSKNSKEEGKESMSDKEFERENMKMTAPVSHQQENLTFGPIKKDETKDVQTRENVTVTNKDNNISENTDQPVDTIMSQLAHPDMRSSLRKTKTQSKGKSMFFGATKSSLNGKSLKEKITSKLQQVFRRQSEASEGDTVTYFEVTSQHPAVREVGHYDVLPPGIRPIHGVDRDWFKQDTSLDIWDTEQTIDLLLEGLIDPEEDQDKLTSAVLTGEYDPKHFLRQVPNVDTTGNELPPWKKMLIAKQIAEKEYQKDTEKKKQEEEKLEYKDMPVWKKAIIQKQDNDRNVASEEELKE